jgi:hypothetical protein
MINFPDAPILNQIFVVGETSWRWDGAKWVAANAEDSTIVLTPVSGATVVLTEVRPYYIKNAATLASLIIKLPQVAATGGLLEVSFLSPVTSLSVRDWLNVAISGTPTSAYGPGAGLVFRYVDDVTKWVYWK